MREATRLMLVTALAAATACGDDSSSAQPTTPTITGTAPETQASAWPPSGPGCAELVSCCAALASDAQLFCRLSVAQPPVDCGQSMASVRTYLGERGASVPPSCAAAGQGSGPGWVALELPEVPGWQRQPAQDHGPEQGYVVEYVVPQQAAATVYVYRGGVQDIRREEPILVGEVERALGGMQRAAEMGRYQGVRPLGPPTMRTLGAGAGAPPAAHQRVALQVGDTPQLSETFVTTHRGFFFKVRVTIFVEPTQELATSLDQLFRALGQVPVAG